MARARGRRIIPHRLRLAQLRVPQRIIGQRQPVSLAGVLEVVANPFFLHEPAGEGEVALAILDAVVAAAIVRGQLEGDIQTGEHFAKDLGYALPLEHARLHAPIEEREAGNQAKLEGVWAASCGLRPTSAMTPLR